jgi:hypothetical protein
MATRSQPGPCLHGLIQPFFPVAVAVQDIIVTEGHQFTAGKHKVNAAFAGPVGIIAMRVHQMMHRNLGDPVLEHLQGIHVSGAAPG